MKFNHWVEGSSSEICAVCASESKEGSRFGWRNEALHCGVRRVLGFGVASTSPDIGTRENNVAGTPRKIIVNFDQHIRPEKSDLARVCQRDKRPTGKWPPLVRW